MSPHATKVLRALCASPNKTGSSKTLKAGGLSDDEIEAGLDELGRLGFAHVDHHMGGFIGAELTASGRLRCST